MIPPKPAARPRNVSLLRYVALFRDDILSSQPARLYRAWMAEFRTPFFRSFLCNDPTLIHEVLHRHPDDFPKSNRIRRGLAPLLGQSVMVTNGDVWRRQRRILDPAFEGGRLHENFPGMVAAGQAAVAAMTPGEVDIQPITGRLALDVIFRTVFSIPIEDRIMAEIHQQFLAYMTTRPIMSLAALLPWPRWLPELRNRRADRAAGIIRDRLGRLIEQRAAEIAAGTAPADLATRILTTVDPQTGTRLDPVEMVDQVATFILAGHETTGTSLAWTLYLLATHPEVQERVAAEAQAFMAAPEFANMGRLRFTRDVYREALRLYPPVPMIVREAAQVTTFRNRPVPAGSQVTISPWHLHRHERIWERPDEFDPDRWAQPETLHCAHAGYLPFSAGPRVCIGAGYARVEGPLLLAIILDRWRLAPAGAPPVPMAHLTVRGRNGIHLHLQPRDPEATPS